MAGTASIRITGDVKQALAVLDALGVKAEEVGKKTENAFGQAATKTGNIFQRLGQELGNWGIPFSSALTKSGDKLAETNTKGQKAFQALSTVGGAALLGIGAGAVVVGTEAIKMAGNFQSAAEHLVTDAGLSQASLAGVEKGMLAISSATGTSSADIVNGMYHVQSALHLGAGGLGVLKVAAQGAKVGNADLDTVSKTLSGTMASYYGSTTNAGNATSRATSLMNQLIATVGAGDMRMQDLSTSLGNVTPLAAAAGLSFAQVGGAIATMTSQNMTAQQATQDLANLIRNLNGSQQVAAKEMAQLGLNSAQVNKDLGKKGLTGTLQELMTAVAKHSGPDGMVLLNTFNQTQAAAADMTKELAAMPPAARHIAQELAAGTISVSQYRQQVKAMPADQQAMLNGFVSTYDAAHKFNQQLTAGLNANQTANQALLKLTGGATGLNTALMLTGQNAAVFQNNVNTIGDKANTSGKGVENWAAIQKTFNQQLDVTKTSAENLGVSLGLWLIPKVETATKIGMDAVQWLEKHKTAAEALAGVIGGTLSVAVTAFTVNKLASMVKGIASAVKTIGDLGKAAGGVIAKIAGLGAAEKLEGDAAATDATEQEGLSGWEKMVGASAAASTPEVAGLGAAESTGTAGAAGAAGLGLGGTAIVGGGIAAVGALAGWGIYSGAKGGSGTPGSNYASGGVFGLGSEAQAEAYEKVHGPGSWASAPQNPLNQLKSGAYGNGAFTLTPAQAAQIVANVTKSKPASGVVHLYQIGNLNVQAQNPEQMQLQLQQKARMANMAGASTRSSG